MSESIPKDPAVWMKWSWADFEPYARDLQNQNLNSENMENWLTGWSRLAEVLDEMYQRLYVAHSANTADQEIEKRYHAFLDEIYPRAIQNDQVLREKLLASGLEPAGFEIPLRNMRAEADLFREANLPLLTEEQKLNAEYDRIIGAQTVEWEGKETTISQLRPVYQDPNREKRERAWRLSAERQLADRQAINELWQRSLQLRGKLAENTGKSDYRAFRWQQLLRFDYTPDDCLSFHQAIEEAVVPVASRLYEKRCRRLGVKSLRPWDLDVDTEKRPPLKPYRELGELKMGSASIFHRVDGQLGEYFDIMVREKLLDLENRKNKAPGAYCTYFPKTRRPFIFANCVGLHGDVQTLLHEGGHAFHAFEASRLKYYHQMTVPMEFAEVASMGMELLASPYLAVEAGGFYKPEDAGRALVEHLEGAILFWPYMAVVDAFQHWVHTNPQEALNPEACDACWSDLWQRFMPGVDWSGLDDVMETGWHRKVHIHQVPFYYVEYGLAQLGAVQVWRNALNDQAAAVVAYRKALGLGGTRSLPELYQAAGARLAFDAHTLRECVALMEATIDRLEAKS